MQGNTLYGIQNTTKEPQKLMWDGVTYRFDPEQVKIMPEVLVRHAEKKLVLTGTKSADGKTVMRHVFKRLTLAEALKHTNLEEHPDVAEAKRQNAIEENNKARLRAEILAELKAQGVVKETAVPFGKK